MRIGDKETDELLAKTVLPTLKKCGVRGIRVDQIVHNDDVDDRIIAELDRADLVIADLTLARPSVYFEAGYAEGHNKPVVYTSRRDHLSPRADDQHGNFRIHFDLQMKPIIDWSHATDADFARRLESRVNLVLRPIRRARQLESKRAEEQAQFAQLPVDEQLSLVLAIVRQRLRAAGYRDSSLMKGAGSLPMTGGLSRVADARLPSLDDLLHPGWSGRRRTPGCFDSAFVHASESLTKSALDRYRRLLRSVPLTDVNPLPRIRPRRMVEHVVLCALRKVPISRIAGALPAFRQEGRDHFVWESTHLLPSKRAGGQPLFIGNRAPWLGELALWDVVDMAPKGSYERYNKYQIEGDYIVRPLHGERVRHVRTSRGEWKWVQEKASKIGSVRMMPRTVHLCVVSGIKSETDLRERLATLLSPSSGIR